MEEALMELVPVSRVNFKRVLQLELEKGEQKFVHTNLFSIAEAYIEPDSYPMVIYYSHEPVGFIMYGQFVEDKGAYWISRLMIDKKYRRKGIAERGMKMAIENMKQLGASDAIFIGFTPGNDSAKKLYEKLGFVDTGKVDGDEPTYRLDL